MAVRCGHCGVTISGESIHADSTSEWLRCPECGKGLVLDRKTNIVYPSAPAGSPVKQLTSDVESAWQEVRVAYGAGAYTASEMMCRKILMHIAVDVAGAKEGKQFTEYVRALDDAGYIPTGLKAVVDQVRERGNGANHELDASTKSDSLTTLQITEHLLKSIYELPGLKANP
jgi:DNA-directed RNA polymerase subunit RPC12/RpoP